MRTMLRGKISLLFVAFAVMLAIPAVALADNVQTNDVDTGGNATKEVGASGNASVRIVGNSSQDPVSGCNVDAQNPATVGFTVSQPSKLTIGSAEVTACNNEGAKSVAYQVTSSAQAGDVITVTTSTTGGKTGSKYSEDSFTVTVTAPAAPADTTAPVLNLPADITEEATGANGAAVTYSAGATDDVDGNIAAQCTPASGSTFPLGETTVNCSATDAANNTANGSFKVNVVDTTAPSLSNVPANMSATATSSAGAVVNYTNPTATDLVDPNPVVTCLPASGSTFAVGTTQVSCTAKDATGNTSTPSTFNVTVAYSWSNFLQPINVTGTQSVFKLGSTVPVKFNLTGASSGIVDGTFYLKYIYTGSGDGAGELESVATTTGTTGTQFRYSDGQYIYNWSTKSVSKPGNYELRVYTDSAGTNLLGKVSIELKK